MDPNEYLDGSGGFLPGCSFLTKGTTHEGTILAMRVVPDLDMQTKKPKTFPSGDPMNVLVIDLQTDEYDEDADDDDGRRSLWARYKLADAIRDARKEAGAPLAVGGWLSVTYTRQDKPKQPGFSGTKHYEAVYEPPDPDEAANAALDDEDDAPPPRRAKKAPAKAAKPARRRPEPEPDDDDEDDAPPPRRAKKATAKAGARRAPARREYLDDDEDGDEPF